MGLSGLSRPGIDDQLLISHLCQLGVNQLVASVGSSSFNGHGVDDWLLINHFCWLGVNWPIGFMGSRVSMGPVSFSGLVRL